MRISGFIFLLFFISLGARSQNVYYQSEADSTESLAPRLSIKLIPSQLLWRFPAYTLGFEHAITSNLGIDYKVGLINNGNNFDDDETYFNNKSGFKSSIMIKNYSSENGTLGSVFNFFNGDDYGQSPVKSFVGFEVFYNRIKFDRTRTFRFDCENGCEYFQKVTYGLRMEELGARINIGFIASLFDSFGLEVAWALGLAHRSFNEDLRKPTGFQRMFGRLYDEDFNGLVPTFNMDIKLVFDIK